MHPASIVQWVSQCTRLVAGVRISCAARAISWFSPSLFHLLGAPVMVRCTLILTESFQDFCHAKMQIVPFWIQLSRTLQQLHGITQILGTAVVLIAIRSLSQH